MHINSTLYGGPGTFLLRPKALTQTSCSLFWNAPGVRACRRPELSCWGTPPPPPQRTCRGHNSESVAGPGREQAFFTFVANVLHARTEQPSLRTQRACVRPDASSVAVCLSARSRGCDLVCSPSLQRQPRVLPGAAQ